MSVRDIIMAAASGTFPSTVTGDVWRSRFFREDLYGVAISVPSNTGRRVVVGAKGTILTNIAPQLTGFVLIWNFCTSGTTQTLNSVVWSSSLSFWVIVGDSGIILTSPDGINWTSRTSGTTNKLKFVIWSSDFSLFVAVGDSGTILTSPDGITWTSRTSGTTNNLNGVTSSSSPLLIVVVGDIGTILTSSDLTTWTPRNSQNTANINSVAWASTLGVFMAVSNLQTVSPFRSLRRSVDGVNWTTPTFSIGPLVGVAWNGNVLMWVTGSGINSGTAFSSTDGTGSTTRSVYPGATLRAIAPARPASGAGNFTVVGNDCVIYEGGGNTDGSGSWAQQQMGTSDTILSVVWTGTQFVAPVGSNSRSINSSDGITWSNSATSGDAGAVTTSIRLQTGTTNRWAACQGGIIRTGTTGTSWTTRYSATFRPIAIIDFLTRWVSVGLNGEIVSASITSDATWTVHTSGTTNDLLAVQTGIVSSANIIIAVGASGRIVTSPNGQTLWTVRSSGTTQNLNSITWSSSLSLFVAVGDSGTIITSSNGTAWTSRTSGTTTILRAVTWVSFASRFVAVGDSGTILTSSNGTTWVLRPTDTTLNLHAVAASTTRIVAFGEKGQMVITPPPNVFSP